jgi:prepilin-type N-terminal cleavage/methylation domain-containing protein
MEEGIGAVRRRTLSSTSDATTRRSAGFSVLELVIVLAVGGVLAGITITRFGGVQDRMAVRAAQAEFLSLHAQTRASAVERGIPLELAVDPATGAIEIREGCAGDGAVLQMSNLGANHKVSLETGDGPLTLCMTPRGFADPGRNSFGQQGRVGFVRGPEQRGVVILPLGQALRP